MRTLLMFAVVAAVVSGCALPTAVSVEPATSPTSAPTSDRPPTDAGPAARLAELRVVPRDQRPAGYARDMFGSGWVDVDGNGCNQRDDVLLRDAVPGSTTVAPQGRCDHDVLAGTWLDPYTGRTLVLTDLKDRAQSQAVQIDHVVALSEAWASGAAAWTKDRRVRFANDLDGLLAVDGPTNMGKGDDDPAAWRPRKSYQCRYATRWIGVKDKWALSVDPSEAAALTEMLGYCP